MPSDTAALTPEETRLLSTSADRLAARFATHFSPETVGAVIEDSYLVLAATSRVRTHLFVLTERFAAERLDALATVQRLRPWSRPEVLFVCVHNAGRSQIAAALLTHHAAGKVTVRSAGSAPAEELNPEVAASLAELGLDVSQAFPKPLTDESVRAADVVITMGCGDACPVYPGKSYRNWDLDDPAGQDLETVRRIRDEIDARVRNLLDELLGD